MPSKKNNTAVVAICVQEPTEDGSRMDLGAIQGDALRFLHQAFISDTIVNAISVPSADIRLYYIDEPERARLIKIVTDYVTKKLAGRKNGFDERFSSHPMAPEGWGARIEKVFRDCFDAGYRNVLLVGSRTPTFTGNMMRTALRMLQQSDAVFGPTPEGRYYTIGMSQSYHISLSEFDWKSPSIYNDVATAFTNKQLSWSELEIWYAVESSEELDLMARDINQYRFEADDTTARETELVMERLISKLDT
ncbi:MAG: DUF2064 domain-containing protein [Candidatus Zixiibacteriota bacterium]